MEIIRRYFDKRNATINAIKDYPTMKWIIENTKEDVLNAMEDMTSPKGVSYDSIGGVNNPKSGEERIVKIIDKVTLYEDRFNSAKKYMDWFEPAWNNLTEDDRFVLTEFYPRDVRTDSVIETLSEKYHIEKTSVYKKKNRAVDNLKLMLFG